MPNSSYFPLNFYNFGSPPNKAHKGELGGDQAKSSIHDWCFVNLKDNFTKLGQGVQKRLYCQGQIDFPLAARLSTISQH